MVIMVKVKMYLFVELSFSPAPVSLPVISISDSLPAISIRGSKKKCTWNYLKTNQNINKEWKENCHILNYY